MVRPEVQAFADKGPLPDEDADLDQIAGCEDRLHAISRPVTFEEALVLVEHFGPDMCYGMAWTLVHLIESAPVHPLGSAPAADANPWLHTLWERCQNTR